MHNFQECIGNCIGLYDRRWHGGGGGGTRQATVLLLNYYLNKLFIQFLWFFMFLYDVS